MNEVIQVIPQKNFKVYVYFCDGRIVLFDMNPLLGKGVFLQISPLEDFIEKCTVLNGTLAWDIGGNYDESRCIDIDPEAIYESGQIVSDPLEQTA